MPGSPHALDRILPGPCSTRPRPRPGYAIVHIDRRTLDVIRMPILSPLRPVVTYELKLDESVEIYDNVRPIKIFNTAEEATIKFRLSVIARAAQAEKIVQALADPVDNPSIRMLKLVEEAIRDEAASFKVLSPDGLAASIASNQAEWHSRIQARLEDRIGFRTKIIFEVAPPPDRVVVLRRIEMRTRDAPNRVTSIVAHVTLESSGAPAIHPLPVSDYERAERVKEMLGAWFPEQVTLYNLWFEKEKVEECLKGTLNVALKTTGYGVNTVLMDPVTPAAAREEQVKCNVAWTGHSGREVKFSIESVLKIRKDGAAIFDGRKPLPRKTWLEEATTRALPIAMNGLDFQDLNLEKQKEVDAKLKVLLRVEAQATGQVMDDPLLTKIILPESKWLENAIVQIPARRYKTKNNLVDAEFGIRLEVQFASLRPLIEHVHTYAGGRGHNADYNDLIESQIQRIVMEAAIGIMLETEETEYYADFEPWVYPNSETGAVLDVKANGKLQVRQRIQNAIATALQQSLKPARLGIILSRVDSDVAALIIKIQSLGRMSIAIDIDPLGMRSIAQRLPIVIVINSASLIADHIAAALRRDNQHLDTKNVRDSSRLSVQEFLQNYEQNEIFSLRLGRRQPIFADLESHLNQSLADAYGFTVQLEAVTINYSAEMTIALQKNAYDARKQGYYEQHKIDELEFNKQNFAMMRTNLVERINILNQRLKDNPQQSSEDVERYRTHNNEHKYLMDQMERINQKIVRSAQIQFGTERDPFKGNDRGGSISDEAGEGEGEGEGEGGGV